MITERGFLRLCSVFLEVSNGNSDEDRDQYQHSKWRLTGDRSIASPPGSPTNPESPIGRREEARRATGRRRNSDHKRLNNHSDRSGNDNCNGSGNGNVGVYTMVQDEDEDGEGYCGPETKVAPLELLAILCSSQISKSDQMFNVFELFRDPTDTLWNTAVMHVCLSLYCSHPKEFLEFTPSKEQLAKCLQGSLSDCELARQLAETVHNNNY